MKDIKKLLSLSIILALVIVSASCKQNSKKLTVRTDNPESSTETASLTNESVMKLMDDYRLLCNAYNDGLTIDKSAKSIERDGVKYYPVKDKAYKQKNDLVGATRNVFAENPSSKILNRGFDGMKIGDVYKLAPLFTEENDRFYSAADSAESNLEGCSNDWNDLSVKIISSVNGTAEVEIYSEAQKTVDDKYLPDSYKLVFESGKWKLSDVYSCGTQGSIIGVDIFNPNSNIDINSGVVYLGKNIENADIKNLIAESIPKARIIESDFCGGIFDVSKDDVIKNKETYYKVIDKSKASISELKSLTESLYSEDFTNKYFYNVGFKGINGKLPMFIEKSGSLYSRGEDCQTNPGWNLWLVDTLNIENKSDTSMTVSVKGLNIPEGYVRYESLSLPTWQLKLKFENDRWVFDSPIVNDEWFSTMYDINMEIGVKD